jgi:MFS family permease
MFSEIKPQAIPRPPLQVPAFQLLWGGWTLVAVAIQFYAVALLWLVLRLTGSGLELSSVLVVAAIPRAIMMFFSGTIIDRSHPRTSLVASALISALLVTLIAGLLAIDWMDLVYLYLIVAVQGIMDAFFYPSAMALMTRLVDRSHLTQANSLLQTSDSVANILGPAAGGFAVQGLGLAGAFGLNAGLFVVGCLLVFLIRRQAVPQPVEVNAPTKEPFGQAILNGLQFAWRTPAIRVSLGMIAMLNFAAIGPVIVGLAVVVEQRFGGDAAMYGILTGGYGIGALVGGLAAGFLPVMKRPGLALAGAALVLGLGLGLTGLAPNFWVAFGLQIVMGVAVGVVAVFATTWLQLRTPEALQGRMASLMVFAAVALDPFSNAVAGALIDVSLTGLFLGAGALMIGSGLLVVFSRAAREE